MTLKIPAAPAGTPKIDVVFDLNSNGILTVSATNTAENMSSEITIVNDKGRLQSGEIEQMLKDAEKFRDQDQAIRIRLDHQSKLMNCAKTMLAFHEKPNIANKLPNNVKDEIVQKA